MATTEVPDQYLISNSRHFDPDLNAGSLQALLDDDTSQFPTTRVAKVKTQIKAPTRDNSDG